MSGARITSWPTTQLSARGAHDVVAAAADLERHARDQPAERGGAGDAPAVDHAVVGRVRVAGEEHVHLARRAVDDVLQRTGQPRAAVGRRAADRGAALVQEHDDRLHLLALQLADVAIGGVRLVGEVQHGREDRQEQLGRSFERHPDEADPDAADALDHVRREERPAGPDAGHVGGQEREVGAAVAVAVGAAVARVAAAALEPQQLGGAFVELVVADRADVEADRVQRLDRRLVVEERRQQRAGADEVAGGHDQRVAVAALERADVRREVLGAAGGHAHLGGAQPAGDRPRRVRLEVAVEVVDPEQLDLDLVRQPLALLLLRLRGRSRHEGGHEREYQDPGHCDLQQQSEAADAEAMQ